LEQEHGSVVPTWNVVMVQPRGRANVIEDESWLMSQIEQLINEQELAHLHPWSVSDARKHSLGDNLKFIAVRLQKRGQRGLFRLIGMFRAKSKTTEKPGQS
jgi:predicted FMN-binding regulatory protein PaiB